MVFKNKDFIIISIICLLLGVFMISQFYAGKQYKKVITPENNAVLAVEVAKLTKNNADLRLQVKKMTTELDVFKSSSESTKNLHDKYFNDINKYDQINGAVANIGQGVVIKVGGKLKVTQTIDLVNALKNIGSNYIAINNNRVVLNSNLLSFGDLSNPEIQVLGNGQLLKSAIERKGGISEQIASKDITISVVESEMITIPIGVVLNLQFSKIVLN